MVGSDVFPIKKSSLFRGHVNFQGCMNCLCRYYLCGLFSWGVLTEKVIREAGVGSGDDEGVPCFLVEIFKSNPQKTKMTMEIHHLKMYFLLNIGIFQCHVSFQGCILRSTSDISECQWHLISAKIQDSTFKICGKVTWLNHYPTSPQEWHYVMFQSCPYVRCFSLAQVHRFLTFPLCNVQSFTHLPGKSNGPRLSYMPNLCR